MSADLPLLTIAQVAEALGTTERHIRRLVSEHRIPYTKVGHKVRFRPSAVDAWLRANTVDVAS